MESVSIYKNCIFCQNDLNENRFREHVIPANIYGFFTSLDVCNKCGEDFGEKIDDLGLQQPVILEALRQFGNPKINDYERKLPFFSIDSVSGNKIRILKKGNEYTVKNIDDIADSKVLPWLLKKEFLSMNTKENDIIKDEIERIKIETQEAEIGQITSSEILKRSWVTKNAKGTFIDKGKIPSITPLIAKIATFSIFYMINPTELRKIKFLGELINHAKFLGSPGPVKIFETKGLRNKAFYRNHELRMGINKDYILISISLFIYLRWVIFLDLIEPINMVDDKNEKVGSMLLGLDFNNENDNFLYRSISSEFIK